MPDGTRIAKLRRIDLNPAGHPIPDERGAAGSAADSRNRPRGRPSGSADLRDLGRSVGAAARSARRPLTLAAKQEITRQLLNAGATIHELNTVRKHLSAIKGGQLAAAAYPARVLSLILSDVIGDDLDVIGSGPTVGDPSTVAQAESRASQVRR